MPAAFEITWDYLCPFARNAHEHLVEALRAGADWDVHFRFFSLAQAHVGDGGAPVWQDPLAHPGVLAGLAGIVVRDQQPERFLDAHMALFVARHDHSLDLRDREVVSGALGSAGLDGTAVIDEALSGWPAARAQAEHEELVERWQVFGVPTFILRDRAVFVRVMTRPQGDAKLAEATIERVVDLVEGFPELNEYKFTTIPR
ncbi:MAG TPA: DsbA family protein [Acidimicrobiales bacterium]|nr:DsbA family protein [Acidimicrobiales bacterium]